jgi:hypothetical protein
MWRARARWQSITANWREPSSTVMQIDALPAPTLQSQVE